MRVAAKRSRVECHAAAFDARGAGNESAKTYRRGTAMSVARPPAPEETMI